MVSHKQIKSTTCNCLTIKDIIKNILDPSKNENADLGTFSFSMTTPVSSTIRPMQTNSMEKDKRICPYGKECTRKRKRIVYRNIQYGKNEHSHEPDTPYIRKGGTRKRRARKTRYRRRV
jgi:hypothetical protein